MDGDVPIIPHDPSAAFRRTRLAATGLLLFMAALFLAALFGEQRYPLLSWLRAFAEAAMIGALADWYAVTALFKQPLGLPIPHTEIIPRNKDRIASSIGSLTQRKLVTPEAIGRLIESWRIPDELTSLLVDPQRRRGLTQELAGWLARLLETSEDAAVQRFIRHLATKLLDGLTVAPLTRQLVSGVLQSLQRNRLVNDALALAIDYVDTHRDPLSNMIAQKLPWSRLLGLVRLDKRVARRMIGWFRSVLRDVQDHPDDSMRQSAEQWFTSSDGASRQVTAIKELLMSPVMLQIIDGSWHSLKEWLLADLKQEHSETRAYLDAALAGLGDTLKRDEDAVRIFQEGLQNLVVELATRHRDRIGELVTNTVRDWSVAHMVETIEREVGKDLQFIRINGTVVGGLIGLLLHAVAMLFGKM
ncbi:conserved membrane protein of unknown function [Nitrospira japonica]|uniref:DUF445 domain-containing protein n=1 Tax=Nitrospira japonica TaxID=1325564 RepID=A0A1W1I920_9BACT|nr:DUF445 domain-containing protein [Nitrospira japonica]SLM49496.1 conserved membrane protein of unknown function [Nitrospira japonica]